MQSRATVITLFNIHVSATKYGSLDRGDGAVVISLTTCSSTNLALEKHRDSLSRVCSSARKARETGR